MTNSPNKKIHPKKFALWVAIGSIIMMFGGFTSGYIVRMSQGNWLEYTMPWEFYVSTAVILLSSLTMHLSVKTFKNRDIRKHRRLVTITLLLGIAFTVLQITGFYNLFAQLDWQNNVSFQFIVVITAIHALHVIGGIVALAILYARTFSKRVKTFSPVGIEMAATYWHFVDILWIYLFVFFLFT